MWVDVCALQLCWSAMFRWGWWWLEFSLSQVTCWFPEEATDPGCPGLQPLDSKHDPRPSIILSKGRNKDGREVKRQEGGEEGGDVVRNE